MWNVTQVQLTSNWNTYYVILYSNCMHIKAHVVVSCSKLLHMKTAGAWQTSQSTPSLWQVSTRREQISNKTYVTTCACASTGQEEVQGDTIGYKIITYSVVSYAQGSLIKVPTSIY